jgi:hypothetical protein
MIIFPKETNSDIVKLRRNSGALWIPALIPSAVRGIPSISLNKLLSDNLFVSVLILNSQGLQSLQLLDYVPFKRAVMSGGECNP